MTPATRASLSHGRWHWRHGPIDLVVEAHGDPHAIAAAHAAAWSRFEGLLVELVAELSLLKARLRGHGGRPTGAVARRMHDACRPHRADFITSMAAVAGAVADELIEHYRVPAITRAWINNGGDIALHLGPGASVDVGVVADIARIAVKPDVDFAITHDMPVRGVATSGWRGRSCSLGIADSVTVLARSAADADAAATMIANAVDVDDARIVRSPASSLKDDSDLEDRLVTVAVPALGVESVRRALDRGRAHAEALRADGVIASCVLACQGMMTTVGSSLAGGDAGRAEFCGTSRLAPDAARDAEGRGPWSAWQARAMDRAPRSSAHAFVPPSKPVSA